MKSLINNFSTLNVDEKVMISIGCLGVVPFIIGMLDLWLNQGNLIFPVNIPKYYGVIILTFLGSIYWGIILVNKKNLCFTNQFKIIMLIWSVLPSLFGMVILLIDKDISLIILSVGYLICQITDEIYNKFLLFPNWYILYRRLLSLTVIIILIFCYLIIKYY